MSNYLPAGTLDREMDPLDVVDEDTVNCTSCERELNYYDTGVIEVATKDATHYFCNDSCRAKAIWEETKSASGRADLLRVVAALHLLMEADIISRVPAFTTYEVDYIRTEENTAELQFGEFRNMALAYLRALSPDACDWATEALDMAGEFAGTLSAKAVASFAKTVTSALPVKESHDAMEVAHA
jgi:hypothetical protein